MQSIGFKSDNISFVPISGLEGVNLIEKPSNVPELKSWYSGATLLDRLENFKPPKRSTNKPLRVCVYDYFKATEGNLIGDCV